MSKDRCNVPGCVIPDYAVTRCQLHGCMASLCSEHGRKCEDCELFMCFDHFGGPICYVCEEPYAAAHEEAYRAMIGDVADEDECEIDGCDISHHEVCKCAWDLCDRMICAGHARTCGDCEYRGFCPTCLPAYACVSCVQNYDDRALEEYGEASAAILTNNARRYGIAKRKADGVVADEPASKVAKTAE